MGARNRSAPARKPSVISWKAADERLRVEFLPDSNTRAFEALTGNLDLAAALDPGSIATLRQDPSLRVVDVPEALLTFLAARVDDAPLNDSRLRQALRIVVDRSVIANKVFLGFASSAMEFVPPWTQYATLRAAPLPHLREAAALLDFAGWRIGPGGIRERAGRPLALTLTFGADVMSRRTVALLLQSQSRRLGIDVALRGVHTEALLGPDGNLARGNFQLALFSQGPFSPGDPDRSALISSSMIPPAGVNYARYRNSQVDAAVTRANKSLEPAGQAARRSRSDRTEGLRPLIWRHETLQLEATHRRSAGFLGLGILSN